MVSRWTEMDLFLELNSSSSLSKHVCSCKSKGKWENYTLSFICLQKHGLKYHRWATVCYLKHFVHPLLATPKVTWNGSLNYFAILICLKKKTLMIIVKLFIKTRGGEETFSFRLWDYAGLPVPENKLLFSGWRKGAFVFADSHYSLFLLPSPREIPLLTLR